MDDRIKLAGVMGWDRISTIKRGSSTNKFLSGRGPEQPRKGQFGMRQIPDPFTDANDDYAVLEWARCNWLTKDPPNPDHPNWDKFCDALWENPTLYGSLLFYKVGDYARAASKVIETVEDSGS